MKKPNILEAMRAYAINSKERFPSYDADAQAERVGTTFYADFMVGEVYGMKGLNDTWKRAWAGWKNDCKYCVELAVCLNHRCWELYNGGDEETSRWYADKFHEVESRIYSSGSDEEPLPKGCKPFSKEERSFAFSVLD